MSTYFIGDIHGCYDEFKIILEQVQFNPKVDNLWLTGDLVSRGPGSLEVLRLIYNFGKSVRMVLGNHDLHLLAIYTGIRKNIQPNHYLTKLLEAPDVDELINWLRYQPILQVDENKQLVMAHAGITPQWNITTACTCAREIENILKSDSYPLFLDAMYGDMPNYWNHNLSGFDRLRFSTNVFTRMRYCFPNGQLEMNYKDIPEKAPVPLQPWFSLSGPISERYSIVFGHWASLKGHNTPPNIYGLDTGCCWGGQLTLLCWENKEFVSIPYNKKKHQ